ncbi:olfactory receptor 6B1-like [Hyla sarda]|uniref:olfactory receptor 6B1-like n=1 Tax=Hyla sarda TaxID=327740 RepID=UPI0024C45F23|nr:olfactory receptor 6B1-like [Hyla sarda]
MFQENISIINKIHLLGFHSSQYLNYLLFSILLLVFCLTLCENLLLVTLVKYSSDLHRPMYFFLTQLSIADLLLTIDIVPILLHILLHKVGTISFTTCLTQFYIFACSECSECLLLTVMSYDRFLAICNPLRYTTIMNHSLCLKMVAMNWLVSFSISLVEMVSISMLEYCGPDTINHFFCDLLPILELSCSDINGFQVEIILIAVLVLMFPFIVVIISYSCIVYVILKIPSATGRQKAFSTCSSHLIVVSIFYGTLFGVYVLKGQSLKVSKLLSLLYTVGTPLVNPVIYSLRNTQIIKTFKTFKNHVLCICHDRAST